MTESPSTSAAAPRWTLRLTFIAAVSGGILLAAFAADLSWGGPPPPSVLWNLAIAAVALVAIAATISWAADRIDGAGRRRAERLERRMEMIAVALRQELGVQIEATTGDIPRIINVVCPHADQLSSYDKGYADGLAHKPIEGNGSKVTRISPAH